MKTNEISKLLKENNIKIKSYRKYNNSYVVETNEGKLFISENKNNRNIFEYLEAKSFDNYPKILLNDRYQVTKYIKELDIPIEQKINDLIDTVSLLHKKTSYSKKVNNDDYIKIYEDLVNEYNYLFNYYNNIIESIDNSIFLSPSNYLLSLNITLILDSLNIGMGYLENWLEKIKKVDKMRVCVINNDLSLSNYRRSDKSYLINWNRSKIDIPVYDLYNFYNNENSIDFIDTLNRYEKKSPLSEIEKDLLIILLLMPDKLNLNDKEYDKCKSIKKCITKLLKTHKLINKYKKSIND